MDTAPEENGNKVLRMAAYINRDAVHDLVRSLIKYAWASPVRNEQRVTVDADDVQFGVDKIPSADVAPVRHGRWIAIKVPNEWDKGQCSQCRSIFNSSVWGTNYCPNCGAKMDGRC